MGQSKYVFVSLLLFLGCGRQAPDRSVISPPLSPQNLGSDRPETTQREGEFPNTLPQSTRNGDLGSTSSQQPGQSGPRADADPLPSQRPSPGFPQQSPSNSSQQPPVQNPSGSDAARDGSASQDELERKARAFTLPPNLEAAPKNHLWATFYHTLRFQSLSSGYPLLAMNGSELGPKLSKLQWCQAAMEGSVQIFFDGAWRTYNYSGTGGSVQVDCTEYYDHPVGRTRFGIARGPYGDGVRNYILSPFRTIAVDPAVIPYGTVIYIEAARGLPFTLSDGQQLIHDGYFFAGDTGGLIHGNHIDVFIGNALRSPFPWITSNSKSKIAYQVVASPTITNALLALHMLQKSNSFDR